MTIAVRPGEQAAQALLDARLGVQVDVGGRLVEHEDARVGDQRAGEGDQLALAGRQLRAALADLGVVAVGQLGDELLGADCRGGGADLLGVASGRPKAMFSATVPENRKASCGTMPICERSELLATSRRSWPSTSTRAGGRVVEARDSLAIVDLPAPVAPTSATVCPGGICRSMSRRARALPSASSTVGCPAASRAGAVARCGVVGEGDVVEVDLAARCARARSRRGGRSRSGCTSSSWKIFSSAAMPGLVGGVELRELLDRFEQVRQRGRRRRRSCRS